MAGSEQVVLAVPGDYLAWFQLGAVFTVKNDAEAVEVDKATVDKVRFDAECPEETHGAFSDDLEGSQRRLQGGAELLAQLYGRGVKPTSVSAPREQVLSALEDMAEVVISPRLSNLSRHLNEVDGGELEEFSALAAAMSWIGDQLPKVRYGSEAAV